MTARKISITPAQGVYALFGSFDYTAWQAIGEFVDNSVSSWWYSEDDFELRVDIDWDPDYGEGVDKGQLTITDNALGIATGDLNRAFELATPPTDLSRLNQFGVGMKVAACWFGREWTVETSAKGENVKRIIHWDTDDIVRNSVDELSIEEVPAAIDEHFTVISIRKLIHAPSHVQTIGKIKRHLPKMFRKFSEGHNLSIRWNGEELLDQAPGVLKAPHFRYKEGPEVDWEMDFEIELGLNRKAEGYACIFERFDRQHTGLNYFWRGRLIQGNVEPFHRPQELFGAINSFRSGRLYIELMADDFNVTSDKTAIDFGKSRLREADVLEAIKKALSNSTFPLLQQAENYRSNQPPPDLRPRVDATLEQVKKQAEDVGPKFLGEEVEDLAPLAAPASNRGSQVEIADRLIEHEFQGSRIAFRVSCVDAGSFSPWIEIEWAQSEALEHSVLLNLAHPFIQRHLTSESLPIIVGFGVSILYGEFKAYTMISRDEVRLLRKFTDRFMRFLANYEEDVLNDRANSDQ